PAEAASCYPQPVSGEACSLRSLIQYTHYLLNWSVSAFRTSLSSWPLATIGKMSTTAQTLTTALIAQCETNPMLACGFIGQGVARGTKTHARQFMRFKTHRHV
ncbi:hypothetical protein ACFPAA_24620, partial [Paraburkholderia caffeinitolerans]